MKVRNTILAGAMAVFILASMAVAHAGTGQSVQTNAKISLTDAVAIAVGKHAGTATSATAEYFDNQPVYVIMVETDTVISEKTVHGTTGLILGEVIVRGADAKVLESIAADVFEDEDPDDHHHESDWTDDTQG